jgi:hypothetical protein
MEQPTPYSFNVIRLDLDVTAWRRPRSSEISPFVEAAVPSVTVSRSRCLVDGSSSERVQRPVENDHLCFGMSLQKTQ